MTEESHEESKPDYANWVMFTVPALGALALFAASSTAAWQRAQSDRYCALPQSSTMMEMRQIADEIGDYRNKRGALPDSLSVFQRQARAGRVGKGGEILDSWRRPLMYTLSPRGNDYTITSYGRDGRPSGAGLDGDISISADGKLHQPEPRITFRQFMADSEFSESILWSIATGIGSFLLSLFLVSTAKPTRRGMAMLIIKLLVTVVFTLCVGAMLATLHLPAGH